jgi:hypothetical protein
VAKYLLAALVAGIALVAAAPALADAPVKTTNVLHLGPFVDDETCAFPITFTVDRTRTVTTFANGDSTRHVDLTVVQTANGHTAIETDKFDVFIDHADPTNWKITGRFGQTFLDGKLIYLQSGLISYNPVTDTLADPHPGPMSVVPDACTILAA